MIDQPISVAITVSVIACTIWLIGWWWVVEREITSMHRSVRHLAKLDKTVRKIQKATNLGPAIHYGEHPPQNPPPGLIWKKGNELWMYSNWHTGGLLTGWHLIRP